MTDRQEGCLAALEHSDWTLCKRQVDTTAAIAAFTYLSIIVIVSLRFCPWKGRAPVSISNCNKQHKVSNCL